ncbi:MAG: hypothetical protein KC776_30500 [Myxococcales bacterium]|nr:hypothetical protein [Myxococcales bacterium]MCB9581270.1 hypothetical protein [Polyangiaceae bacterium]
MTLDTATVRRTALSLSVAVGLAGSFYAGMAYAHDSQLDDAHAHLVKAVALLKASTNPNATHAKRPFGGHRGRAISLIERAEKQIAAAAAYADK